MQEENNSNDKNVEQVENTAQETVKEEAATQEQDLQAQLQKQKEYYLRIVADCEDRMKRTKQDAIHSINLAIENMAGDLFPLLNDLSIAMQNLEGNTKTGLALIEKNFLNTLKKYGIEEIKTEVGQDFDANLHNAISVEEKEGVDEGKITQIIQPGYKLKDKVITPVMVMISK